MVEQNQYESLFGLKAKANSLSVSEDKSIKREHFGIEMPVLWNGMFLLTQFSKVIEIPKRKSLPAVMRKQLQQEQKGLSRLVIVPSQV